MAEERLSIGGQAVIEGVMMRNKANVAVAVRQEKGNIFVQKMQFHSISERCPFLKWPLLEGLWPLLKPWSWVPIFSLSAEQVLEGEEEELKGWELPLTLVISLAAGIGLLSCCQLC